MKLLYIECGTGLAGDMLMSSLSELLPEPNDFIEKMNNLGIPSVRLEARKAENYGISGTHITVKINGEIEGHEEHGHHHSHEHEHHHSHEHHSHTSMAEIEEIIANLNASEWVKEKAVSVYKLIAGAEAEAHGKPVTDIHFHEVGRMDAIADIVGTCLLIEELAPEKIIASPVCTGFGQIECAHGILPVPAPATAYILRGIPSYCGNTEGELCTPTGAALVRSLADEFDYMPVMRTEKIGYGMGTKKFSALSCVRTFLGEVNELSEQIFELRCNIDDMSPEYISYAAERLFDAGALDVFTTPVGMKKSRSGVLLTVLCKAENKDTIIHEIFRHTATIGIRENLCSRYTLSRNETEINTEWGTVRVKNVSGFGVSRKKYEYEDLARIAKEQGISIEEVKSKLM